MPLTLLSPDARRCPKYAPAGGDRCDCPEGHAKPHISWTFTQGRPAQRRSWWVG